MSKDGTRPLANQHGDGGYDLPQAAPAPTGRELDALIAEKVMGWANVGMKEMYSLAGGDFGEPSTLVPDGEALRGNPPNAPDYAREQNVPHYSTMIAAAWLVVEHLQKRNLSLVIGLNACANGHQNGAKFYKGHHGLGHSIFDAGDYPGYEAVADSVPLAICRAAITAIAAAPGRADD